MTTTQRSYILWRVSEILVPVGLAMTFAGFIGFYSARFYDRGNFFEIITGTLMFSGIVLVPTGILLGMVVKARNCPESLQRWTVWVQDLGQDIGCYPEAGFEYEAYRDWAHNQLKLFAVGATNAFNHRDEQKKKLDLAKAADKNIKVRMLSSPQEVGSERRRLAGEEKMYRESLREQELLFIFAQRVATDNLDAYNRVWDLFKDFGLLPPNPKGPKAAWKGPDKFRRYLIEQQCPSSDLALRASQSVEVHG